MCGAISEQLSVRNVKNLDSGDMVEFQIMSMLNEYLL